MLNQKLALLLFSLLWLGSALAETNTPAQFSIDSIQTIDRNNQLVIAGKVNYQFSPAVIDAVEHGVPVTIKFEMKLIQVRRWWLNKPLLEKQQFYVIKFHALSQQYLLSTEDATGHIAFSNLGSLLHYLGTLESKPLAPSGYIKPDINYQVAVRASLDIEALPPALRPRAYISDEWDLDTGWYRWFVQN